MVDAAIGKMPSQRRDTLQRAFVGIVNFLIPSDESTLKHNILQAG